MIMKKTLIVFEIMIDLSQRNLPVYSTVQQDFFLYIFPSGVSSVSRLLNINVPITNNIRIII